MPPPKRRAPRRTAAAIGEDLMCARWAGGLHQADEEDLAAALDWLSITGVSRHETPLSRARDLLLHHIKRTCEAYRDLPHASKTTAAAAVSLQLLLLRPIGDTRLAQTIRRDSVSDIGHNISPDAVRHREDKLIAEIAQNVSAELEIRRLDVPQTVEDAVHRLAPIVIDLRQDLHDLLCVIYAHVPPADPRERRAVGGTYQSVLMELGALLAEGTQLVEVGRRSTNLTDHELQFVASGRLFRRLLFDEANDREYMIEFIGYDEPHAWEPFTDRLLSTDRGKELYERYMAWISSCYPTCAFERTVEIRYMCTPHAVLTGLYDFEARYISGGYSEVYIPAEQPIRHHQLGSGSSSSGR